MLWKSKNAWRIKNPTEGLGDPNANSIGENQILGGYEKVNSDTIPYCILLCGCSRQWDRCFKRCFWDATGHGWWQRQQPLYADHV